MDIKSFLNSQHDAVGLLKSSYEKNRLSHAYLFHGAKGVGKKEIAFYFSTFFYCKEHGCLNCNDCKSILNNNHLNVYYIEKAENKTVITVEQIENLHEEFSKTSLVDGPRIYIIDGIDIANTQAQNKLLKFIEEPDNKEATYGIFLAENINQVLPTIKSRCQIINFKDIDLSIIQKELLNFNFTIEDSYIYSLLSSNINDIIKFYEDEDMKKVINLFLEFIRLKNDVEAAMFLINHQNFLNNNLYLTNFMKLITIAYRDILLYKSGSENVIIIPLKKDYEKIIQKKSSEEIQKNLDLMLKLSLRLQRNIVSKNILNQLILNIYK